MSKPQHRAVVALVGNRFQRKGQPEIAITDKVEEVAVLRFETQPAIIKREYGATLKQGPPGTYDMARVHVGIEVPCYVEDIALADEWAQQWVEQRVIEEMAKLRR